MSDRFIRLAEDMGRRARQAARAIASADTGQKNRALSAIAERLRLDRDTIKQENARDLEAAREAGLPSAMVDRLTLDDKRIDAMARGVEEIAELADPIGEVFEKWERPNGLRIERVRVPIGVVLQIYESRPNVTIDAAALYAKSGNACILRGGKEAVHSNQVLHRAVVAGLESAGLPAEAVQMVELTDHEFVDALLRQDAWIDLVIPRGGERLIRAVVEKSTIPVIKHYKGVCHIYVDATADLERAAEITVNAKCQRPGVCNAMETLLVHADHAGRFLPEVLTTLAERGVTIRGCPRTRDVFPTAQPATDADWDAEYLDLILAVRVVDSLDEAIDHIAQHGSGHTDAILTGSSAAADAFVRRVDSSSVMVNASTRFSDGGEYGLGAEVGISTDKLHARGPMGIRDLTTYKYVVRGDGHVRT